MPYKIEWTRKGFEAQPQSELQYRRMIYMRNYRERIKQNEIIYIKKSKIIKL